MALLREWSVRHRLRVTWLRDAWLGNAWLKVTRLRDRELRVERVIHWILLTCRIRSAVRVQGHVEFNRSASLRYEADVDERHVDAATQKTRERSRSVRLHVVDGHIRQLPEVGIHLQRISQPLETRSMPAGTPLTVGNWKTTSTFWKYERKPLFSL